MSQPEGLNQELVAEIGRFETRITQLQNQIAELQRAETLARVSSHTYREHLEAVLVSLEQEGSTPPGVTEEVSNAQQLLDTAPPLNLFHRVKETEEENRRLKSENGDALRLVKVHAQRIVELENLLIENGIIEI